MAALSELGVGAFGTHAVCALLGAALTFGAGGVPVKSMIGPNVAAATFAGVPLGCEGFLTATGAFAVDVATFAGAAFGCAGLHTAAGALALEGAAFAGAAFLGASLGFGGLPFAAAASAFGLHLLDELALPVLVLRPGHHTLW